MFSVKGGRFITHMKKLANVDTALATFFASGLLALREKLGPILWQLPPNLGFDAERLAAFFALLPRSTGEAAWLARKHDERIKDRALTTTDADRPMRHALEVRHDSFLVPAFLTLLREHAIAVVVADTAGKWPQIRELTADFGYLRLHGADELYVERLHAARRSTTGRRWSAGGATAGHDVFTLLRQRREGPRAVRRAGAGRRVSDGAGVSPLVLAGPATSGERIRRFPRWCSVGPATSGERPRRLISPTTAT